MEAANYISYTIQVGVPSKEEKDIQGLFALDGGSVILSLGKTFSSDELFLYSIVFQLCHFGYRPALHLNSML